MVKIKEALVVEGRYDKNTLAQLVDAPIFVTNGFGVFKDPATLALLRSAAEKRGLIILTDSDGAGLVIRNHLKGALPPELVKHAYIPDVPGKEKRKAAPGKEGKLGVGIAAASPPPCRRPFRPPAPLTSWQSPACTWRCSSGSCSCCWVIGAGRRPCPAACFCCSTC